MEEKSSSWSMSTASPSEWWPHWCQSQTKTQRFVWPLTHVSRLRSAWHVCNAYLPEPSHCMLLPKARCPFCAAHETPRGTAGPVDEMDSHAQNWCTYGLVANPDQIFMTGWSIAACEHAGCNLGSTRISWPVQSVWGPGLGKQMQETNRNKCFLFELRPSSQRNTSPSWKRLPESLDAPSLDCTEFALRIASLFQIEKETNQVWSRWRTPPFHPLPMVDYDSWLVSFEVTRTWPKNSWNEDVPKFIGNQIPGPFCLTHG